ncbi:MAG: FlgD immunoglobulin-like domain containing protein, partial [candidate division KSB1 bacterium]
AYLLGSFNAPNALVTLVKNSQLRGAICAKELLVERDCLFLHHDSPGSLPGPGNLPKSSSDEEVSSDQLSVVSDYALEQNYPNPFNPSTKISFALPEASEVELQIFNEAGQLVRTLASGNFASGRYELHWDARNQSGKQVAAGVYLYRLTARGQNGEAVFSETKRMTLLK